MTCFTQDMQSPSNRCHSILEFARTMRKRRMFCDVEFRDGSKAVQAHRLMLAYCCPNSSIFDESHWKKCMQDPQITLEGIEKLICYIYGEISFAEFKSSKPAQKAAQFLVEQRQLFQTWMTTQYTNDDAQQPMENLHTSWNSCVTVPADACQSLNVLSNSKGIFATDSEIDHLLPTTEQDNVIKEHLTTMGSATYNQKNSLMLSKVDRKSSEKAVEIPEDGPGSLFSYQENELKPLQVFMTAEEYIELQENKHLDEDFVKPSKIPQPIAAGVLSGKIFTNEFIEESDFNNEALNFVHSKTCPANVDEDSLESDCGYYQEIQKLNAPVDVKFTTTGNRKSKLIYVCDHCGKDLPSKASLLRHVMTHTGEKPFRCRECGKSFTLKVNLVAHEGIHDKSRERKYACSICSHRAYTKSQLHQHQLNKHIAKSESDLYRCEQCWQQLCSKAALEKHKIVKHGNETHPCTICGKTFSWIHYLKQHIKRHQDTSPNTQQHT